MKDKVIIITGASSGIGLASANILAEAGAKVVLAARRENLLNDAVNGLGDRYGKENVMAVRCDVTSEEDCRNLIEKTVERFGRIDVLVNNAGISMRAWFKDLDLQVEHRLMDVNFWGTVNCTKYALPYLLKSKGQVVGVISIAGFIGLPGRTGYSASKFAIRGFLNTLRIEHLKDGLNVMIFAPGYIATEIRKTALLADGTPQGSTPRKEEKMMTAEQAGRILLKALRKRKAEKILTPLGKTTVFVSTRFPRLADRLISAFIAKEK